MIYHTSSVEETEELGAKMAKSLLQSGKRRAFLALDGDMGVGKTALTRGFAGALGCRAVRSPTYTVVNEYRDGVLPLFHFDLYRIADEDDLYTIGFDDYLAAEGYCLCEWASRLPEAIPADAVRIVMRRDPQDDGARIIEIEGLTL